MSAQWCQGIRETRIVRSESRECLNIVHRTMLGRDAQHPEQHRSVYNIVHAWMDSYRIMVRIPQGSEA